MPSEKDKHAHQQRGHEQKSPMQQRVITSIERIGVRLVLGKAHGSGRMALLAGGQNVDLGKMRPGIGGRQHIMVAMTVVTSGDI